MKLSALSDDEYRARMRRRMDEFDNLPREWRLLVHEYSWSVCKEFKVRGISAKDAKILIRHTLHEMSQIYRHDLYKKKGQP